MRVAGESACGEPVAADHARPIDHPHLARYTLGDRALEREVLRLFSSQAEVYLDALRQAKSPAQWAEAAHSLKGSAQAIGASRVAAAAIQAEAIPAAWQSRERCLAAVAAAIEEADQYIRSLP